MLYRSMGIPSCPGVFRDGMLRRSAVMSESEGYMVLWASGAVRVETLQAVGMWGW